MDCVIEQKYHRNIMGAKGINVQEITQEHKVSIKFPEKSSVNGQEPVVNGGVEGEEEPKADPRNVIIITGRVENVEAAKQALLVSGCMLRLYINSTLKVSKKWSLRES